MRLIRDLFCHFIHYNFNKSLFISKFSTNLKNSDVIPVHKKKDETNIDNYRPISIPPTLSKCLKGVCMTKCMFTLIQFFQSIDVGFVRDIAQNGLLPIIVKWRPCVDDDKIGGAILTDLLKAFDCINHGLFIAKLAEYGFRYESLNFARSYLADRKYRINFFQLREALYNLRSA